MDWEHSFHQLMRVKKRFILPALLFLMLFYFCLPLTIWLFPKWMNETPAFVLVPWGWLYAFSQLFMTWLLGWLYWRKAKRFDRLVAQMKQGTER